MESLSIEEVESNSNCAATTAVGDNVAPANSSLGKESDPETSTVASTVRFARIDSSSAHPSTKATHPPSLTVPECSSRQVGQRPFFVYAQRGPKLSDLVH